jgi:hypothetical protein
MKTKIVLFLSLLCLLVLVLFVPVREVVVVPEWKVRFEDESHKSIPGLSVKQEWREDTYEPWRPMHSEVLVSDQNGEVVFPERVLSISVLADVQSRVRYLLILDPHVSFGPFSTVRCDGEMFSCYEAFSKNDPVPLTVNVFRKRS